MLAAVMYLALIIRILALKVLEESRETSFKKFLWRGRGGAPEDILNS